jgi:hypothetical protein
MRMNRMAAAALAATASLAGAADAASVGVLWDQPSNGTSGVVNTGDPTSPPEDRNVAYVVSDVTFATDVVIRSVQNVNFMNTFVPAIDGSLPAVLNIFGADDPLTLADDPTDGGDFGTTLTALSTPDAPSSPTFTLTAAGLDIGLAAGTYWIGLTPLFDGSAGDVPRSYTFRSEPAGQADTLFFGTSFGGPAVQDLTSLGLSFSDANIRIEGQAAVVPLPAGLGLLLAALAGLGLAGARRRPAA